jgi:hypothetical protein
MTPMRSAIAKASSWSCVTRMVLTPSSCWILRIVRRSSSRIFASSAPKGSSSRQHLGPVRECARDSDALLLAARELGGQAVVHALEGDELQELGAPLEAVGALHAAYAQRELDVVGDAHVAEQA